MVVVEVATGELQQHRPRPGGQDPGRAVDGVGQGAGQAERNSHPGRRPPSDGRDGGQQILDPQILPIEDVALPRAAVFQRGADAVGHILDVDNP